MLRRAFHKSRAIAFAGFLGILATPILAHFPSGTFRTVPVIRLLTNVGQYVAEHPKNARGHYTLGRIHSLAFANPLADTEIYKFSKRNEPPEFAIDIPVTGKVTIEREPSALVVGRRMEHLLEAIREYRKAVEMAPKEGLYFLGLAWDLEQGAGFIETFAVYKPETMQQAEAWRKEALENYRKAYDLTLNATLNRKGYLEGDEGAVPLEAGEAILRLIEKVPRHDLSADQVREIRNNLDKLSKVPKYVTPIIFPLEGDASLSDLTDAGRTAKFDLAATGRAERWPWINYKAGILVWDPNKTGRITSGQQLFGSRTWQMFWKNGYEPLAALDNNGDGWLTGTELNGIAVWQDRNGNGRSDKGEVIPMEKMGIAGICVRPSGLSEGVPSNTEGIRLQSGATLPTYDWTPVSVRR